MLRVEGRGESAGGGVCRETVLRHATFTCRVPLTLQVGVGPDKRSALAEICIVNFDGEVVYHRYVKPQEKVTGEQMLCLADRARATRRWRVVARCAFRTPA